MNFKKDFCSFFNFEILIILFSIIKLSESISICNGNQYFYNGTCNNCPENSTSLSSGISCNCTNSFEYFDISSGNCKECPDNFSLLSNKSGCMDCSLIEHTNSEVNCSNIDDSGFSSCYDKDSRKCKCGLKYVLFEKKNKCIQDSYSSSNPTLYDLTDNDTDNVCFGIGYQFKDTTCDCQDETYSKIIVPFNSSFSLNICTKTNTTRRRLQQPQQSNLNYQVVVITDGKIENFTAITDSSFAEKLTSLKETCELLPSSTACNVIANYCVLALYTLTHQACVNYININKNDDYDYA